jgi:hypothetical protein
MIETAATSLDKPGHERHHAGGTRYEQNRALKVQK